MSRNGSFNSKKKSNSASSSSFTIMPTSEPPTFPITVFYSHLSGIEIVPLYNTDCKKNEKAKTDSPAANTTRKQALHEKVKQKQKDDKRLDFALQRNNDVEIIPNRHLESLESAEKFRKVFHCVACDKTFKFQTSLLRHNNKVHMSKYQCQTCKRVFSRQAYLDVHTSKQNTSCYLAQQTYNSRSLLSSINIIKTEPT